MTRTPAQLRPRKLAARLLVRRLLCRSAAWPVHSAVVGGRERGICTDAAMRLRCGRVGGEVAGWKVPRVPLERGFDLPRRIRAGRHRSRCRGPLDDSCPRMCWTWPATLVPPVTPSIAICKWQRMTRRSYRQRCRDQGVALLANAWHVFGIFYGGEMLIALACFYRSRHFDWYRPLQLHFCRSVGPMPVRPVVVKRVVCNLGSWQLRYRAKAWGWPASWRTVLSSKRPPWWRICSCRSRRVEMKRLVMPSAATPYIAHGLLAHLVDSRDGQATPSDSLRCAVGT